VKFEGSALIIPNVIRLSPVQFTDFTTNFFNIQFNTYYPPISLIFQVTTFEKVSHMKTLCIVSPCQATCPYGNTSWKGLPGFESLSWTVQCLL